MKTYRQMILDISGLDRPFTASEVGRYILSQEPRLHGSMYYARRYATIRLLSLERDGTVRAIYREPGYPTKWKYVG